MSNFHYIISFIFFTISGAVKVYFFQNDDFQLDGFWDGQGKIVRGNQRRGIKHRRKHA